MPARVAPSPEQIAEVLRRERPGRLVPWAQAVTLVRVAFRTTTPVAQRWIGDAITGVKGAEIEQVGTYDQGHLSGPARLNNGRWPTMESEWVTSSWREEGYPPDVLMTKVHRDGTVTVDYMGRGKTEAPLAPAKTVFVVPSDTMRSILEGLAAVQKQQHLEQRLLAEAGVRINRRHWNADAGRFRGKERESVHLTLNLYEADLHHLSRLIERLGISPVKPS